MSAVLSCYLIRRWSSRCTLHRRARQRDVPPGAGGARTPRAIECSCWCASSTIASAMRSGRSGGLRAEWLAWRCGISLSAAREKVRTAQALLHAAGDLGAFAEGRLSYWKVRALTRVASDHDEIVAGLCAASDGGTGRRALSPIRNVSPESVHGARRAWERRSLTVWRDEARGTLRFTVELPIEEGELIARAVDCAVAAGEVATGVEPDAIAESKGMAWRAQQADALVAVARRISRAAARPPTDHGRSLSSRRARR